MRRLLELVLCIGNFTNQGRGSGNAAGFRLTSLLTLGQVRLNPGVAADVFGLSASAAVGLTLLNLIALVSSLSFSLPRVTLTSYGAGGSEGRPQPGRAPRHHIPASRQGRPVRKSR